MDLLNRGKIGMNCNCYPVTGHWRQLRWSAPMFPPKCLEKQGNVERGCLCLGVSSQHIRSFSIVFLIVVFPSEWTSTPCFIYFILVPSMFKALCWIKWWISKIYQVFTGKDFITIWHSSKNCSKFSCEN